MALDFDPIAEARRNWEAHGWGGAEAMMAATSIARAQQIILGRIDEALAPLGLTFSRFEALALLYFSRSGALPMGKIGARLQVHPTSVTNTIDRLERAGLVDRVAAQSDRRSVLARITDEGRVLVPPGAAALAAINFGLSGLADTDLGRIHDAVLTLRHEAGDFTPPGGRPEQG